MDFLFLYVSCILYDCIYLVVINNNNYIAKKPNTFVRKKNSSKDEVIVIDSDENVDAAPESAESTSCVSTGPMSTMPSTPPRITKSHNIPPTDFDFLVSSPGVKRERDKINNQLAREVDDYLNTEKGEGNSQFMNDSYPAQMYR